MSIQDQVAVVTGASRGIGRAIAVQLAQGGAKVIVHYQQNEEAAQETLTAIEKLGGQGFLHQASLEEEEQVVEMFKYIGKEIGQTQILVCNAGRSKDGLLVRMSLENFEHIIQVNLRSCFLCLREAGKQMMKSRYGRIVGVSSVSGINGNPGQSNYAASKAGMIGLIKSFALEMARWDITANIVAPGPVETDMISKLSDEVKDRMTQMIPKNRFASGDEIAAMVNFLVQKQSSYITGKVLRVDGGLF